VTEDGLIEAEEELIPIERPVAVADEEGGTVMETY
jgi:hypothetical protein